MWRHKKQRPRPISRCTALAAAGSAAVSRWQCSSSDSRSLTSSSSFSISCLDRACHPLSPPGCSPSPAPPSAAATSPDLPPAAAASARWLPPAPAPPPPLAPPRAPIATPSEPVRQRKQTPETGGVQLNQRGRQAVRAAGLSELN